MRSLELDDLREHLLAMPHAEEGTPFGPDVLVYKVGGKMFATLGLERMPPFTNLKCDPERALELREEYPDGVLPGYHMNKKLWNSVMLDGSVPVALVEELIQHSWELIVASLPRKVRDGLRIETAR